MQTTIPPNTVTWTPVCTIDQLEPLWGEAAIIGNEQVAIVLFPDGELCAVSNRDPVTGASVISRGIVGSRGERRTIASPLHKQVYDLRTGEGLTSGEYSLRTFAVRVVDGVVLIGTDAAAAATSYAVSAPDAA